MSEWQPIETAPMDGTEVIVYCLRGGVGVVHLAWFDSDGMNLWESQGFTSKDEMVGWWSYTQSSISQEKLEGLGRPLFWQPFEPPK